MDSYLENMISHWNSLKKLEGHYETERLKAEDAIQQHLQHNNLWKDKGTMSFENLKIRINYSRKWDQKYLAEVKTKHHLTATQFPFVTEYKELKTQSDYLEVKEPEIWQKISPALLIVPTKPYFFTPKKGE
ncbi:MAG: hypothetical protein JSS07_04570 [Proteobacteria bacterium]|nr:hypothetical protein [Pseudomonadota bacterium]